MGEQKAPIAYRMLGKGRMEALSDGIFAFAMTLLVLNIEIPEFFTPPFTADHVEQMLVSLIPAVLHYVIAFLMIASFWLTHHKIYDRVKKVDGRLIWLNIAGLLLIGLMPFTIDFAEDMGEQPLSAIVFQGNIFLLGFIFFGQMEYVFSRPSLMDEPPDADTRGRIRGRILLMPALSLIGMGLAVMGLTYTTAIYLLVPLIYVVLKE